MTAATTAPCDLSVVIVTYDSRPYVGACIRSLRQAVCKVSYEIVVADNASPRSPFVRRVPPRPGDDVRVVEMSRNLGFAAGCNAGIAAARGRHLLLLNPDTEVAAGALDELVGFLDGHPEAGAVAPRLVNPDGSDQGTARAFPTPAAALFGRRSPLTALFPRNPFSRRYLSGLRHEGSEPFEVDWVSGACLMVSRAALDAAGPLDEGFFMYWEDADWCRRIKAAGFAVFCVPAATVVHDEGARRRRTPEQVRWFHESAYRYYAKHHARATRRLLRPAVRLALRSRAEAIVAWDRVREREPFPFAPDGEHRPANLATD
ncbi:MAG TPA: glycosyltransferase family 2 protein [Acidimicrobiales bacterium]|nr:glycosyltransferase family 2 protein [Acidimicrobiales bacterium]